MAKQKQLKKISIIWGLMLILVFGTMTTFSLMWKKKNQGYKNLEKELVTKVEGYFEQEHKYPTGIEVVTIDLKELQEHDIIQELKYNDDICNGYVDVSNDIVIKYKAYIKCNKYQTKGYNLKSE